MRFCIVECSWLRFFSWYLLLFRLSTSLLLAGGITFDCASYQYESDPIPHEAYYDHIIFLLCLLCYLEHLSPNWLLERCFLESLRHLQIQYVAPDN